MPVSKRFASYTGSQYLNIRKHKLQFKIAYNLTPKQVELLTTAFGAENAPVDRRMLRTKAPMQREQKYMQNN